MDKKKTRKWRYYYIGYWDLLGRGPDTNNWYYTYENGEWLKDVMHFINDHLIGYSPDRIGDPDVRREICEISEEEAMAIMARQDKEGRRNGR